MDLLSVNSIGFDTDIRKTTVTFEGNMSASMYFHMMKTRMKSFAKTIGGHVVETPATALVDNDGNPIAPAGGVHTDPEGHHTDFCGEITINGSGGIDVGDQTIIAAVPADKRLAIHSIYISTTSAAGVINLDFFGDTADLVDRFYAAEGRRDEIQRHKVSALAESLKITGSGLDVGAKIFYAIQAVEE